MRIVDADPDQRWFPAPVVDLVVRTSSGSLWLTIGSGTDAAVVRSIVRSLHAT